MQPTHHSFSLHVELLLPRQRMTISEQIYYLPVDLDEGGSYQNIITQCWAQAWAELC